MNPSQHRNRGFTLIEIMTVVVVVGLLSAIAVPALMHVKHKSEDTLALNTIRQFYDAKELYFAGDGAGNGYVTMPILVKAGYASHSLDAATQHNIGPWGTTGLRSIWSKPGNPVKISEEFRSGNRVSYGRTMVYPAQP
jgi:prepilin-type N-terminal cleavage/methylation domain-containing protein